MILCIPAGEAKGLSSAFEGDFARASTMVIFDTDSKEIRAVPVNPDDDGATVPAYFHAVLCSRIRRDVWRGYLQQGVRFFGVDAATVGEAVEKYRKGDIAAVSVLEMPYQRQGMSGCACGGHGHHREAANHACCGGKGHGHGACGGCG